MHPHHTPYLLCILALWIFASLYLHFGFLPLCLSASPHVTVPPCHLAPSMVFPMSPCHLAHLSPQLVPMSPQLEVANCDFKFSTHPPPSLFVCMPLPLSPCPLASMSPSEFHSRPPRVLRTRPHPTPKRGQTPITGSDYEHGA